MAIRRKSKEKIRKVVVEFDGKTYTLKFSSDLDQILSGLGIALLSLGDPKVNAILKQFGLEFYDEIGEKIGSRDEN